MLTSPAMDGSRPSSRSNHFRRQVDDADEFLLAQFAGHRTKDARAARIAFGVDQHHRVAVETNVTAVVAAHRLFGADNHALDDLTRLDVAAGNRLLDAGHNDVADAGIAPARAAQHLDTHALL